jgi:hypothetical protein
MGEGRGGVNPLPCTKSFFLSFFVFWGFFCMSFFIARWVFASGRCFYFGFECLHGDDYEITTTTRTNFVCTYYCWETGRRRVRLYQ